jgi:chitinase
MTITPIYSYAWSSGNPVYKISDLTTAQKVLGLKYATLAFVISDSVNPTEIWSQITASIPDMQNFIKNGGFLIISCGGATGSYLESTMSEDQQFTALDSLLQQTGCRGLDFDVEGSAPSNISWNTQRAKVITRLQQKYPGLYISYTIAINQVMPTWDQLAIPQLELSMLQNAISLGVKINTINGMLMDTSLDSTGTWGGTAVNMCESMHSQIKTLYPNLTDAQAYTMIGATPMIGRNDNSTIFTLADTQTLTNYAIKNNIGVLSFWALQRDQSSQAGGLPTSSMISQTDFAFYNIIKTASMVTPTPTPTPKPSPNPLPHRKITLSVDLTTGTFTTS